MTEVSSGILPAIIRILGFALVMAVGWLVVKFIFKLAAKVFTIGCVAILIIAAIMLAYNFFG